MPVSEIFLEDGEYLMNISIGTPAFQMIGIFDINARFTWVQCKPCDPCSGFTGPLYDPSRSSTYKDLFCYSKKCMSLPDTRCDPIQGKICQYREEYSDETTVEGNVALDTITLSSTSGQPISFPQMLIRCGHKITNPDGSASSGVIGFGPEYVSFLSQMGAEVGKRFSYCLVHYLDSSSKSSSKLSFGRDAVVRGRPGAVSTPLTVHNNLYYLTLEAISVGHYRFEFEVDHVHHSTPNGGSILIDSCSTPTLLPSKIYNKLESTVIGLVKLKRVPDPQEIFNLCYNAMTEVPAPIVTMHFKGADVKLGPSNTFGKNSEDVMCFIFIPDDDGTSVYGTNAQQNFLVGIDVPNAVVSFKPNDYTKL